MGEFNETNFMSTVSCPIGRIWCASVKRVQMLLIIPHLSIFQRNSHKDEMFSDCLAAFSCCSSHTQIFFLLNLWTELFPTSPLNICDTKDYCDWKREEGLRGIWSASNCFWHVDDKEVIIWPEKVGALHDEFRHSWAGQTGHQLWLGSSKVPSLLSKTFISLLKPSRRGFMFDLRTGKPFEIPERDQFGRCRFVTEFEKLNRVRNMMLLVCYV